MLSPPSRRCLPDLPARARCKPSHPRGRRHQTRISKNSAWKSLASISSSKNSRPSFRSSGNIIRPSKPKSAPSRNPLKRLQAWDSGTQLLALARFITLLSYAILAVRFLLLVPVHRVLITLDNSPRSRTPRPLAFSERRLLLPSDARTRKESYGSRKGIHGFPSEPCLDGRGLARSFTSLRTTTPSASRKFRWSARPRAAIGRASPGACLSHRAVSRCSGRSGSLRSHFPCSNRPRREL